MDRARWIGRVGALCVVGGLLIGVAACGGDDEKTEEEAAADLCTDLDEFGTSFTELVSVDPNSTTVGEFEDAREQVNEDLEDVSDSAEDVANYNRDELEDAYDELDDALEEVEETDTLTEVGQSISAGVAGVAGAWENSVESAGCELPQRGGAE